MQRLASPCTYLAGFAPRYIEDASTPPLMTITFCSTLPVPRRGFGARCYSRLTKASGRHSPAMPLPALLCLVTVLAACSGATRQGQLLATAHAAAMQDSVRTFLASYAADLSAPPVGKRAREALSPFYDPGIVVSTDLSPDEPTMVQTVDSLIPPDEIVSVPTWIRSTHFEWRRTIVTPLSPGLATYSATYVEHVTDTTGTTTSLPGVQQGVVRHGESGWRILAVQSSHPVVTHRQQEALAKRMALTR